ncbi:Hint domain-containing protein [Vannielia litorea]|uniref:Hint domain-containing protein n=1 Tax=Vannielia litorea TaxID=1217970 RepID=A0A1N6EJW9_9RHOB|nr:Hint domain-containing protein [Vannielia litorea]SIN83314.1 Hint domain-containing protein [Vannielia litorea]
MPITITALDNEFAIASGANVNNGPGTSTFDSPLSANSNLTISSNQGDGTPYQFSVGDTYDISYSTTDGSTLLEDAVVVRSDHVDINGDQGGAVVFQGLDSGGEVIQVVWSPGFDLEGWYWANSKPGYPPGFFTTDQSAATSYGYVCFGFGTRIATEDGPVPVERLRAGQRVLTHDHGAQPVLWIGQSLVPGRAEAAPVRFSAGAFGNSAPLVLSQQHRVLMADPLAELHFGAAEVFVPARALVGLPGIDLVNLREIGYAHFLLPRHEVVEAEGLACESLYFGDVARARIGTEAQREIASVFPGLRGSLDLPQADGRSSLQLARPALKLYEARFLASLMWGVDLPAEPRGTAPGLIAA